MDLPDPIDLLAFGKPHKATSCKDMLVYKLLQEEAEVENHRTTNSVICVLDFSFHPSPSGGQTLIIACNTSG